MQLFAELMHDEKLTCSISTPNSKRSTLSWNELPQLQNRGKHIM